MNSLKDKLQSSTMYQVLEILLIPGIAGLFIFGARPFIAGNQMMEMSIFFVANLVMMGLIWIGMRIRGERLKDWGFSLRYKSARESGKTLAYALLFLVLGMAGFIMGSIIMANITGIPESDMSRYDYFNGNLALFVLSLIGVYFASSFGEEFFYRGFLIRRINQLGGNTRIVKIASVVFSALIFGVAHFSWGPMGIGQTTLMGLAFAICYQYMGQRLTALFIAHAIMDTTLLVQLYLE